MTFRNHMGAMNHQRPRSQPPARRAARARAGTARLTAPSSGRGARAARRCGGVRAGGGGVGGVGVLGGVRRQGLLAGRGTVGESRHASHGTRVTARESRHASHGGFSVDHPRCRRAHPAAAARRLRVSPPPPPPPPPLVRFWLRRMPWRRLACVRMCAKYGE